MTAEELVHKSLKKRGFDQNVTAATKIADLNADSLTMMEMKMEMEDELGAEIPDDDLEQVKSVGDFIEVVKRYGKGKLTGN